MKNFKSYLIESERKDSTEIFHPDSIEKHKHVGVKGKNKLVNMHIDHFLKMAEPLDHEEKDKKEKLENHLNSGGKLDELPHLDVHDSSRHPHESKVVGHEGRHRALALKRRGYTHMPVIIKSNRIRYSEQTPDKKHKSDYMEHMPHKMSGQEGNSHNTIDHPITRENAHKSFGED